MVDGMGLYATVAAVEMGAERAGDLELDAAGDPHHQPVAPALGLCGAAR